MTCREHRHCCCRKRCLRTLLLCILYGLNGLSGSTWGRFGTVYYNSVGMTNVEVGIVSATMPLVRFGVAPLWGLVADAFKTKKWVSLVTRSASCALLLLLALPSIKHAGFHAILAVCVAMSLFVAPGVLDAHTLAFLGQDNVKAFGRVRVWTAITWGLGCTAMGVISDRFGFSWNFILFGVLQSCAVLLTAIVIPGHCRDVKESKVQRQQRALHTFGAERDVVSEDRWDPYDVTDDPLHLLSHDEPPPPPVVERVDEVPMALESRSALALRIAQGAAHAFLALIFFAEMFIMGAAASVVEKLLFLFLINDLDASTTLCGLSVGVTVIIEIPLFCISDLLLNTLGHNIMLLIAMAAYCTRVYSYSLLTHDTRYWILAIESLHGITFALLWSAGVERARSLASEKWGSTMQSLFQGSYGCLGAAAGSLVGSWAMQRYGAVVMYRYAAYVVAALFTVHGSVYAVVATFRGIRRVREACKPVESDTTEQQYLDVIF